MTIKTKEEIEVLKEGGKLLARILNEVRKSVAPGVSTKTLDRIAEKKILEAGGTPSFKGYNPYKAKLPYPATLCVSVNDEVVHGIPSEEKILKEGDIAGLDIGMLWPSKVEAKGRPSMFTDTAVTIGVGQISKESEKLLRITKESLDIGIKKVKAGARMGDIGFAIQSYIEKHQYGVIRDLAGHGVGYKVHEDPFVPNFGKEGTGLLLKEGAVLAIEPMATLGGWRVTLDDDEWTFRTADGSLGAHFEHTVVVTESGAEVITEE